MQVQRKVQLFQLLPERQIPRIVQIHDGIQIANLRKSVDHCSFEAQFLDASRQLGDRGVRILHRQSRETCETIRPLCDELRQDIVGFAGHLSGTFRLRYALNRRIMQRQDHELDSILVHFRQTELFEVEQAPLDIRPGGKPTGVSRVMSLTDGIGNRKMFF